MKTPPIAILAALAAAVPCLGAEKLPASFFARSLASRDVQLSPDGKCVGFVGAVGEDGTKHILVFLDLATGRTKMIEAPFVWSDSENIVEVQGFSWLDNDRVVFRYSRPDSWKPMGGIAAVDRDGGRFKDMPGIPGPFFVPGHSDHFLVLSHVSRSADHPLVVDVDASPGRSANVPQGRAEVTAQPWHVVVDDAEGVNHWVPDRDGDIRVGVAYDGSDTSVIWRRDDDAPWERLKDFDTHGLGGFPMAVDWDGRTAYTATLTQYGTWGVSPYDLVARKMGPPIAVDPSYDIITPTDYMVSRGYLLFSRLQRKLIGISYPTAQRRTVWLDPEMAKVQATVDRALPGMINSIWSWSDDETRILVDSWSDRHPGTYYLLDKSHQSLRKLFDAAPWINPSLMGKTYPVSYKTRDGLLVHGYVTIPHGSTGRDLPLVVLPNPSIIFARSALGYSPLTQFLANRGYAVLQVNPRGSPGFGKAFYEAGRFQVGRGIQDDITDGVRWAIGRGIADPRRIAIVGVNVGGYSAEWGLASTPDLYRCGVSVDAICDWPALLKSYDDVPAFIKKAGATQHSEILGYLRSEIGDPDKDAARLRDISPVNHVDRIKAPVLLVTHKRDFENPQDQTGEFAGALKARGAACEVKVFPIPRSNQAARQEAIDYFTLLEGFLARNMN